MRSNKRGKPMECVASPHFCNFSIGFNVLFLVVLRSSKVTILFYLFSFFHSQFLGPSWSEQYPKHSLCCLQLPCTRAFADHRDSVDPEEERTLPTAALTAPCHLSGQFISLWDLESGSFSELPWLTVTLTAGELYCGHSYPHMGRASCSGVTAQTTLLCEFWFMSTCGTEQHLPARGNAAENGLVTPPKKSGTWMLPCSCCTTKCSRQEISVSLNPSKVSVLCPSCDWPNAILYFPFYFTVNYRKYNGGLLEFCIYSLAKA